MTLVVLKTKRVKVWMPAPLILELVWVPMQTLVRLLTPALVQVQMLKLEEEGEEGEPAEAAVWASQGRHNAGCGCMRFES